MRRIISTDTGPMVAEDAAEFLNRNEWIEYNTSGGEEPATLRHPDAARDVAEAKAEGDRYRAISRAYAGLS